MGHGEIEQGAAPAARPAGVSAEAIKHAFLDNLFHVLGKFPALATRHDAPAYLA